MVEICDSNLWKTYFLSKIDIGFGPGSKDVKSDQDKHTYTVCEDVVTNITISNKPTGYTKYLHSPQRNTWPSVQPYVGGIYHNGYTQNGFGELDNYNKSLEVYYLDYDKLRLVPLLVKVINWYPKKHGYYQKDSYTGISDQWQSAGITQDGQIQGKLDGLNESLKELVVLNIGQTTNQGTYFVNGDPSNAPNTNKDAKITVSPSDYGTVYKKYIHNPPKGSKLRPLSTKHREEYIPFENSLTHTFRCNTVSVYYWKKDGTHEKPLLLELTTGYSYTYHTIVEEEVGKGPAKVKVKKWKHDRQIQTSKLKEALDLQNCLHNKAHVLNVSKNITRPYNCLTHCKVSISVSQTSLNCQKYIKYSHKITDSSSISVSRFKEGSNYQTGLPSVKTVSQVNVLFYPKYNGKSYLIHYKQDNQDTWYKRKRGQEHDWEQLSQGPLANKNDSANQAILDQLLDLYAPRVAIKAEHSDRSYISGDTQTINVHDSTEEGKPKHKVFKHTRQGGPFRITAVSHNNANLPGIPVSNILTELTVYYSATDSRFRTPLFVGLKKDSTKTEYWRRPEKRETDWQKIDKTPQNYSPQKAVQQTSGRGSPGSSPQSNNDPYYIPLQIACGIAATILAVMISWEIYDYFKRPEKSLLRKMKCCM